jgi:two-component sensor histidine kinase
MSSPTAMREGEGRQGLGDINMLGATLDPSVLESPMKFPAEDATDFAHETNHRLANSLQLLSAMVAMTASEVTDVAAQAALAETLRRIQAIGRLHRHLYTMRDASKFDLAAYLLELGEDLGDGYCDAAASRRVLVEAEPVLVSPEDALAVGILVSELVGNACKYAYEPRMAGDVRVLLRGKGQSGYELVVEDRGVGLLGRPPVRGTGLGARLIVAMTARLKGASSWQNARPGTRFILSVPA